MTHAALPSWGSYRDSIGDRSSLFAAIADTWDVDDALYPGCYLDLSPSTAIRTVTYVDTDKRAARYFSDAERIAADLADAGADGAHTIRFLHSDYTDRLPLEESSFSLLISLYAGLVWDGCGRYLRRGGLLLANASHGDASIAALDPALDLVGAVLHRDGRYRLDTANLDRYLIAKKPADNDPDLIRAKGRGVAYTRPAFAYLFRRA